VIGDNFPRSDGCRTEPNMEGCERCKGSGTVARSTRYSLEYRAPGPVPEDARGVFEATCNECHGIGYIDENQQAEGAAA